MRRIALLIVILLLFAGQALAQDTALPASVTLTGFRHEPQGWNNCGPATLTNALSYFGYSDNQTRAATWLKPNPEDKNVSPQEMVNFVNSQVPELPVFALTRIGGDLQLLKTLLANEYPVIIEEGYDPPPHDLGWMGHYLLISGYDDAAQEFIAQDSYLGPNQRYSYEHIDEFWRHFNRRYIVLYESGAEPALLELLGEDADIQQNALKTLNEVNEEAVQNPQDPWAWFNVGATYVALAPTFQDQAYEYAAGAFVEAIKYGLPYRIAWYRFEPLEAFNAVGDYERTLQLTNSNLNDGGGQWVEETFYYAGAVREAQGELTRALDNYRQAVHLNGNFAQARAAMERLESAVASTS
jgi:tetratricopeptide (TPR) repeat protein